MKITITRYTADELETAVTEKLKQGWSLVRKGPELRDYHASKYYNSRKHSRVYAGVQTYGKWIAVMKKKEEHHEQGKDGIIS